MQVSRIATKDKSTTKQDESISSLQHEQSTPYSGHSTAQYTPLHFEHFIPWVCALWNVEEIVTVVKVEEGKSLIKSKEEQVAGHESTSTEKTEHQHSPLTVLNNIEIRAIYESKSSLVEISIVNCKIKIPVKVIRAISLCLPFHPSLSRFNIRRGGVTCLVVYEISKLLPHSNLTNVCLDDAYVPEINFDILLQKTSKLSYLSLNRCWINDEVCKKIAKNLENGGAVANTLRALELASNNITDEGAQFLGTMLRANRILLHLNLADNKITDRGGIKLITSLMEFQLLDNEYMEMRRERMAFYKRKQEMFNIYMEDLLRRNQEKNTIKSTNSSKQQLNKKKQSSHISLSTPKEIEHYVNRTVGDFTHVFGSSNTVTRNGANYAKGNLVLCYLNLAYNNLHYPFLRLLYDVVAYQEAMLVPPATGLIRIVLNGNNLPKTCNEMEQLENILKEKLTKLNNSNKRSFGLNKKSKSRSDRLLAK